jgi:F420-dependent oxidoreductase-like protein
VVVGRTGGWKDAVGDLGAEYQRAVEASVDSVWMTQHLGFDALTLMATWGTTGPELGTAVIPAPTRHPVPLAQQAVTTQTLCGGRLSLGLGLAHAATLTSIYGLPPRRSVSYLADYLTTLDALMAGEETTPNDSYPITTRLGGEFSTPPPVLLAALGPRMLDLAGSRTAGTITWMTGPRTVARYVVPHIEAAAEAAGRSAPRVVVCLPVCVTRDPDAARETYRSTNAGYGKIPSYRDMLEREGVSDPGEIAIIGSDDLVRDAFGELFSGGATDVVAIPTGSPDELDATWALLSGICS